MQQTLDVSLPACEDRINVDNAKAPKLRDPAFEDNKTTSIHRWVPWIAGFSAKFVRDTFDHYLPADRPCTILEPFAGVGTTLVEGLLAGHNVIGFEINPYAYLASKVKCGAYKIDVDEFDTSIETILSYADKFISIIDRATVEGRDPLSTCPPPKSHPPKFFKSRVRFFSPLVELKVLYCLDAINLIAEGTIRDLSLLAFGSLIVGMSNYSYEPSLGSRVAAGRAPVDDDDVLSKISNKLRNMRQDIVSYKNLMLRLPSQPCAEVYNSSSLNLDTLLSPHSVDIAVTSPPYLNNYHYIRNTRPHLFWLDFVAMSSELKTIENQSFGKFWQTVRDAPTMNLDFEYPELSELLSLLAEQNNHKGIYGGKGWANYAVQYFNDSYKICHSLKYVLKPGAFAIIVLGNSVIQGIDIPTDKIFAQIAEIAGLEKVDIRMLRTKRVGNSVIKSSTRNGHAEGSMLYETAVVIRQRDN